MAQGYHGAHNVLVRFVYRHPRLFMVLVPGPRGNSIRTYPTTQESHALQVSYTSVLDSSITNRRTARYQARGFDIDRWNELLAEERLIRKEIAEIARDYDAEQKDRKAVDQDDRESVDENVPKAEELKEEDRAMMKANRETEEK